MQLQPIQNKIYEVRGQKVMFDFDLAELYEVQTRVLKQAVRRNIERFPEDFMFELTKSEWKELITNCDNLQEQVKFSPALPFVFTEQGIAMLSSVLRSKKAIEVNIAIMRAFVLIRQYALSHQDLTEKLKQIEDRFDTQFNNVFDAINYLLEKDHITTQQDKRTKIGYK